MASLAAASGRSQRDVVRNSVSKNEPSRKTWRGQENVIEGLKRNEKQRTVRFPNVCRVIPNSAASLFHSAALSPNRTWMPISGPRSLLSAPPASSKSS